MQRVADDFDPTLTKFKYAKLDKSIYVSFVCAMQDFV